MADTPLRSLLAEFVVQVDRAGALAKGNAQVDALKKKLEQLQEAAKPAAAAVGDAFAQAGGSQFTRRAQASVFKGRGSEDAFLQLGKTGGPLLPGLLRPLRQEPAPVPTAPPSGARYQTPEALANVFARAAAGAQRNLQALNAGSFTGGGSGDGFLSAAFRTPGSAPQFGPTRETLNAARAATAAAEAEAAKYAGTLRGKLATAVQAVRDGFERGGGGGGSEGGGGLLAKLSNFRTQLQLLAGSAVVVGIKRVVEGIGDIKTGAQRLGVSTTEFQRLDVLAKQNGSSVETLGTAYRNLSKAAVEPTKQTASAFTQLGVQTKDASGHFKSADDLFWDTISALAGVTDETKRNALAQNVLGRSALQLKPLFADGTAAVQAQREALSQLNVLSPETIEQAHKLSQSWDLVGPRLRKAAEPLLKVLIPALHQLTDWFLKAALPALDKFVKQTDFVSVALTALAGVTLFKIIPALTEMVPLMRALVELGGGWTKVLGKMAGEGLKAAASFLRIALPLLVIEDFITFLRGGDSELGRLLDGLFGEGASEGTLKALHDLTDAFKDLWNWILGNSQGEKAKKLFSDLDDGFRAMTNDLLALIGVGKGGLNGAIKSSDALGIGSTAEDWGQRFFEDIPGTAAYKQKNASIPVPALPQLAYGPPTASGSIAGNAPLIGEQNFTINMGANASPQDVGREVRKGAADAASDTNRLLSIYGGYQ